MWSLRITIAASSESTVNGAEDTVSAASSTRLKWVEKKTGFNALPGLLEPFKFKFLDKLFTRSIPVACGSAIYDSIVLPDPSFHPVDFARGRLLPETIPLRGSSSFRIGVTPSGREDRLSLGDLARHVYVVGQTRSGKNQLPKALSVQG